MPFSRTSLIVLAAVVVIGVGVYASTYTVDETEYAVEIRLGEVQRVLSEPGLYLRPPLISQVVHFDRRLLTYDSSTGNIITGDKKTMLVDNYARWRVVDPQLFYESVRTERGAMSRLDDIVYSQMREILGRHDLEEIVRDRDELLTQVTRRTQDEAKQMGVQVFDVRIKRADLPEANSQAVFGRMEAERRRVAKRYRSEGEQEALRIRSEADREKAELLAEANRKAAVIRGEADAEAARVYAAAYGAEPEFYRFWRSLEAYRTTFADGGSTLLLTDDPGHFLQYLPQGRPPETRSRPAGAAAQAGSPASAR